MNIESALQLIFSQLHLAHFVLPPDQMSDNDQVSLNVGFNYPNHKRFDLKKTIPSLSHRYDRTTRVFRHPASFSMNSLTKEPIIHGTFNPPDNVSAAGWVAYIHPEGLRYYYHPVHHVVTDANLTDAETLKRVALWMEQFYKEIKECGMVLPSSFELLIELDLANEDGKYYIVDHDKRRIFYFDAADTEDVGLPDVYSENHLKLQLEGQYWNHVEYFPMHYALPSFAEKTVRDILRQSWADRATSSLSTSPFSAEDCKQFINILKCNSEEPSEQGYHAWIVARLLKSFILARFINRFGEVQGPRLSRTQSLEGTAERLPSRFFVFISRLLFKQPSKDLDELNELWVDSIVYMEHWRAFNVKRVEELYSVCALATILLGASTVIDPASSSQSLESVVTISQYAAAACQLLSLSSIILGLKHLLIHKPFREASTIDAGRFLAHAEQGKRGLESLAIKFSLPRALLMWALAAMAISLVSINLEYSAAGRAIVINGFIVCLATTVSWAMLR